MLLAAPRPLDVAGERSDARGRFLKVRDLDTSLHRAEPAAFNREVEARYPGN
jgi:hypothetical protein